MGERGALRDESRSFGKRQGTIESVTVAGKRTLREKPSARIDPGGHQRAFGLHKLRD